MSHAKKSHFLPLICVLILFEMLYLLKTDRKCSWSCSFHKERHSESNLKLMQFVKSYGDARNLRRVLFWRFNLSPKYFLAIKACKRRILVPKPVYRYPDKPKIPIYNLINSLYEINQKLLVIVLITP